VTSHIAVAAVRVLLLQFVTAKPLESDDPPKRVVCCCGPSGLKSQGAVQHKNVTNPLVFQGIPAMAATRWHEITAKPMDF